MSERVPLRVLLQRAWTENQHLTPGRMQNHLRFSSNSQIPPGRIPDGESIHIFRLLVSCTLILRDIKRITWLLPQADIM